MDKLIHALAPLVLLGSILSAFPLAGCNPFAPSPEPEAAEPPHAASVGARPSHRSRYQGAFPATGVFTYHNDSARTGLNPRETILTPETVNPRSFGKLFSNPVDGYVYAQPLYVPGVSIPGRGRRNVIYVATENNSIYAFDAEEGGRPLWQVSLLEGGMPVPFQDFQCDQIVPQVGITSTPVIDAATRTLYAVSMVKHVSEDDPSYAHRLHALDLATGEEKFGAPITIGGSVPGIGEGQVRGRIAFDPFPHLNRPGLALARGVLYVAFGSHCDLNWFHGWVFAYNAGGSRQAPPASDPAAADSEMHLGLRAVYNTTPNGYWGSIWQSGAAPAIDARGDVFVITGNGTFRGSDYAETFLKLRLRGNSLGVVDSFTPHDRAALDEQDIDLGASGPLLLPDQPGPHPHLMVGAGKSGTIYLVDRDRMGGFAPRGQDRQIVQVVRGALAANYSNAAYWNGYLYWGSLNDSLKAFSFSNGRLSAAPVSHSTGVFGYPGASASVSSDGDANGIVWALQNDDHYRSGPAVLHAYDARDLSRELYNSAAAGPRDIAGPAVKFAVPTIANGRVYLGTQNSLDVYGLVE